MSLIWVICGPGRGVGKTHLAQRLCEVLPEAVCAKCGTGRIRGAKPENFFRTQKELAEFIEARQGRADHIVVESNAMAHGDQADLAIFVDAVPIGADRRKDADTLRERADLVVARGAPRRRWAEVLRRKLPGAARRRAVLDVLAAHRAHLDRNRLAPGTKVWLTVEDQYAIGAGLGHLLENVDRCGTMRGAARTVRMSYRHAWELVRRAEEHLGWPLMVRKSGGTGGGRSELSPRGHHLLDVFVALQKDVWEFAARRFGELYGKDSPDG
jgi:molybdate transport system regulatory protein